MGDLSAAYGYDPDGVPYVRPLWDGPVTTCRLCGNPAADDPSGDQLCWPCFGKRVYPRVRGAGAKRFVGGLLLFVGAIAALMVVLVIGQLVFSRLENRIPERL